MNITVRRSDEIFGRGARINGWRVFAFIDEPASTPDSMAEARPDSAIDQLYDELDAMPPGDPSAAELLARLALLEEAEANRIQRTFEQRLSMPLSTGRETVEKVERLLATHGDPSSKHKSP